MAVGGRPWYAHAGPELQPLAALKSMVLHEFLELGDSSMCVPCEDIASLWISELSGDPAARNRCGTCAELFFLSILNRACILNQI